MQLSVELVANTHTSSFVISTVCRLYCGNWKVLGRAVDYNQSRLRDHVSEQRVSTSSHVNGRTAEPCVNVRVESAHDEEAIRAV